MKYNYFDSPSSSPPTPPSPLPISVGPGNVRYCFSASPSPSPPFSPVTSSPESTPLLLYKDVASRAKEMSSFWLDGLATDEAEKRSSCFQKILEWLFLRCCCCCNCNQADDCRR